MENKTKIMVSDLPRKTQEFLEFKRSTGLKYATEEKILRQFVRFSEQSFEPADTLPADIVHRWIVSNPNHSNKTISNNLVVAKEFFKYLFQLGYEAFQIPSFRCKNDSAFVPHIFTYEEMLRIWAEADKIKPMCVAPNMHRCIPVLFRLLWATGLRVSEALSMTMEDINFSRQVIVIKHAKLDKERLIPISDSTAKLLQTYIDESGVQLDPKEPIFYFSRGKALNSHQVYQRFRLTMEKCGIPYEGPLKGPRVHDLRHTFAVNAMNQMADQGQDLYTALPKLSAYLGHSSLSATERYVRLTKERFKTVTDALDTTATIIFPEVSPNGEI